MQGRPPVRSAQAKAVPAKTTREVAVKKPLAAGKQPPIAKKRRAPAKAVVAASPRPQAKAERPQAKAEPQPAPLSAPAPRRLSALAVTKPSPAVIATSALFQRLDEVERHAIQLALSGQATLLEASPRARDPMLFAAAASLTRHPVVVASPLAAELSAQAAATGIEVATLGSFVSPARVSASMKRVERGGSLLVVVEPAQLFDAALQRTFAQTPLALLGIAAAHACSEHAHELSPAYSNLREVRSAFAAPVLATCTSTSARVVDDIIDAVGAKRDAVIRATEPAIDRSAQVVPAPARKASLLKAIIRFGGPGIVLTATAQEADNVFAELSAQGVACVRAHSGMAPIERSAALAHFAEPRERLVLVTQSPHANASGLAGCHEAIAGLASVAPRPDLSFVLHYQAPLSLEQQFEDTAWLPAGAHALVLADSSDAALVQALLAQQRIKPAAIEAVAEALAHAPEGRPAFADTLALRAGTSRRSADRVLSALADRNLITRNNGQILLRVSPDQLTAEGRLLSARFATLRAADKARAELFVRYVTDRHRSAPHAASVPTLDVRHVRG